MKKYKFTISIIIINLFMFLLLENKGLTYKNLVIYGGLFVRDGQVANWWSVITYGFLHKNWNHLFGNVLYGGIIMLYIENKIGSLKTLIIYFLGIIFGGIAFVVFNDQTVLTVGASAGIYAIMGSSLIYFFLKKELIEKVLFLIILLISIRGFNVSIRNPETINYIGHIFGFMAGVVTMVFVSYSKKEDYYILNRL